MYSIFVGCDISKAYFDASYCSTNKLIYLGRFDNQISGFKEMVRQLKQVTESKSGSWMICFENTGVYSKPLLEWLISQEIPCKEENALQIMKSSGLRRGKDDKIDSKMICRYAFEKRDSLKPSKLPSPKITLLKKLLSRRTLMIKHKTALSNSLKEQKSILDPDVYQTLNDQNEELIEMYQKHVDEINQQIEELMMSDEELKKNYQLAQSVVGVGPVISAFVISFTENFQCFTEPRKFASFSGVAPFSNESGIKKGPKRVSHMANKQIKALLSNAAQAAIQYDPQIRGYYQRKIAQGKHSGLIYNAIKNKLIHRVFAVIRRQTPYVKLPAYI